MKSFGPVLSDERTIAVGNVRYLLVLGSENIVAASSQENDNQPKLVLIYPTTPGETVSAAALDSFRSAVLDPDDVFQPEFFANVVFYGGSKDNVSVESSAENKLSGWGAKTWSFVQAKPSAGDGGQITRGPYVILNGQTWQPWRIYYDFNACFLKTLKPSLNGTTLDEQGGINARVVVPSRCYFSRTKERPLHGARISVKDNIDVEGHKSTLCNLAWEALYPPASKHAACVQKLLDAGAVIVGKVKLQAMIMREEPLECVEFSAPFNPRGDGYQVPSGSSHASAAGIGSYDWLDYSLGSDTNGSGRKPAHYNGCFSVRPTTGIMDTEGVIGQFDKFDMPVFFGRDITEFDDFIKVWYGGSAKGLMPPHSGQPVRVLFPLDYLPTTNAQQSAVINKFVGGLEKALNVKRTEISLADAWKADLPDGQENSDLKDYLYLTGAYPYYYDSYQETQGFRDQYQDKFGKPPFVHRYTAWQWDISKDITKEERDDYWRRSEKYREWLLEKIFKASSETLTVMVFPIEVGEPNYRDSVPAPFTMLSGYASLNMSPMMRAPEVTAIAGQITYESRVTQRKEPYPVGVSLIGAPGTDRILVSLVEKGMKAANIPLAVKTGPSVY